MSGRRTTLLATLALLAITAGSGSTFFLIKDLLDRVPTLDFLGIRFAIAALALVLMAPRAFGRLGREARRHAVVLGLLFGFGQILQTAGLAHTAASVSGFITGLYVVATPLFAALLLRTRVAPLTWGAVLLAVVGLAVLTLDGFSVGYGEALTFVAAMLYALHIVGLGAWSTPSDAMGLAIVQLMVIAVVSPRDHCSRRDRAPRPNRGLGCGPLHGADPRRPRDRRPDLGPGAPARPPGPPS